MAAGIAIVAFKVGIPPSFERTVDTVVAMVLILLGGHVLLRAASALHLHRHAHAHDGSPHSHLHVHVGEGGEHGHFHPWRGARQPLLMGLLHGLAGGGALVLLVMATIPSPAAALPLHRRLWRGVHRGDAGAERPHRAAVQAHRRQLTGDCRHAADPRRRRHADRRPRDAAPLWRAAELSEPAGAAVGAGCTLTGRVTLSYRRSDARPDAAGGLGHDTAMTDGPAVMKELRAIQRANGYIPATALHELSDRTGTPLYQIQGVVSFYPHFRLTPAPPVEVLVCDDLSCHRRGAVALLTETQERVAGSAPPGSVVRAASCLGRCDRAPACAVNDVVVSRVTADSLMDAVAAAAAGTPIRADAVVRDPRTLDVDPYGAGERYGAARKLAASGDTNALIAASRPATCAAWAAPASPPAPSGRSCATTPGDAKYVVCNADESEPGTFKDRESCSTHARTWWSEGMLPGRPASRAPSAGIVYIRHEYEAQIEAVERAIATRASGRAVGGQTSSAPAAPSSWRSSSAPAATSAARRPRCSRRWRAAAASRATSRPSPAPTACSTSRPSINNVETFGWIPVDPGPRRRLVRDQGMNGATGLGSSPSAATCSAPASTRSPIGHAGPRGHFDRAGGVRGGRTLKAFAPSGPSCRLPAAPALLDTPLDFEVARPHARLDARLRARSLVRRTIRPACSTWPSTPALLPQRVVRQVRPLPGRLGRSWSEMLGQIARGRAPAERPRDGRRLAHAMHAHLDLRPGPGGAGNPIRSGARRTSAPMLDDHLLATADCPAGVIRSRSPAWTPDRRRASCA